MAPQTTEVPMNIAEMMVAIGRIEQMVTPLEKIVERLTAAEAAIVRLEANKREPIKPLAIITAIALCVTIVVGFTTLNNAREDRTSQQVQIELQKKQIAELQNKVTP